MMMDKRSYSIDVREIANGVLLNFRVNEGYRGQSTEPMFYPSMKALEADLLNEFGAARQIVVSEDADEYPPF